MGSLLRNKTLEIMESVYSKATVAAKRACGCLTSATLIAIRIFNLFGGVEQQLSL